MYKHVVGGTYSAHDAMADSLSLMEIVTKMDETASMSEYSFSFPYLHDSMAQDCEKHLNLPSFEKNAAEKTRWHRQRTN